MLSPEKITRAEFDEALGRYPALIKSISSSKTPAKDGQEGLTLEQLDKYRFEDAPARYYKKQDLEDPKAAPTPLTHTDVIQLVRWKLKHGTFRPNLLKLAESNSAEEVQKATLSAFETYKGTNFDASQALTKLTTLKGIGTATASLLLSIHDAPRIPFFSDELFQWLCRSGLKVPIKYNPKEYAELLTTSRALLTRLVADARDLEKVAFVLLHDAPPSERRALEPNGTKATETEGKKGKKRGAEAPAVVPREPTAMTDERKRQLVAVAAKGRAARVAKQAKKAEKGVRFRERVDAAARTRASAREESGEESGEEEPVAKAGVKRKSEAVASRGLAAAAVTAKRGRRSNA